MTSPDPGTRTGRVAVVGDVGGHLAALRQELQRLGADPATGRLPDDLTVVQVGDLVHRGPDSDGVVALVERYLREQPERWVQLLGNHEAQYVRPPAFDWPERIGDAAAATIHGWWEARLLRPAVAVRSDGVDWLVTHAGLTAGYWEQVLERPPSARLAAAALDSFAGRHDDVLLHAGQMLGGGPPDGTAGPVWASAATELVPSWLAVDVAMPFDQVHGHSTLTDWRRGRLDCRPDVAARTTLDVARSHETTLVGERRIVGVDPKHGARANRRFEAYVLDDAVVLPR